jgi:hypothetical protein
LIKGLTLVGYNQDRSEAGPGEAFLLTLFWEKEMNLQSPVSELALDLIDESGQVAQRWQIPPVRAGYPPELWQLGERVLGQHALRVPAALDSGSYQFQLEGVSVGSLAIHEPDRLFDNPGYETGVSAIFEDQIELAGYTLKPSIPKPGSPLTITLVWKGLVEIPVSYRVFVHLVDEDGEILVQSDAEPATWTRPTTGWAPGEYVIDSHTLLLPEGLIIDNLILRVGIYDAVTNNRLLTSGDDFVSLDLDSASRE